jgi:hypothetical protein
MLRIQDDLLTRLDHLQKTVQEGQSEANFWRAKYFEIASFQGAQAEQNLRSLETEKLGTISTEKSPGILNIESPQIFIQKTHFGRGKFGPTEPMTFSKIPNTHESEYFSSRPVLTGYSGNTHNFELGLRSDIAEINPRKVGHSNQNFANILSTEISDQSQQT